MNKKNLHNIILLTGLIVGALMAGFSIIEKSNLSNFQLSSKIEDTSIPIYKYLTQLYLLSNYKRSPITQKDKDYFLYIII